MAKISIKAGTTSKLLDLFISDSSSTTGAGLTGLVYNASGLTAYYYREGAATATAITLATMTLGTWANGGFIVVDGTNMPGCYQLGIPDAAIASGAKSVLILLKGATNMAPLVLEVELTAVDNQSATAFVTGINSLAPPTNWNLEVIDGSGRVDVSKIAGTAQTARDIGASVLLSAGTGTGQLDFTSGVTKANATQWLGGTIPAVNITGVPLIDLKYTLGTISPATAGSVRADAVTGITSSDVGAIKTQTDKLAFTVANQIDANVLDWKSATAPAMTGDAYARLGAPAGASVSADVASVKTDTGTTIPGRLPAALVGGRMDSNLSAIGNDTTALTAFQRAVLGNVIGTCDVGGTTTSIVVSSITPATSVADQLKGRIVTFDKNTTTAALRGQATDVTASTASATPTLTVTALTTAAASTDTFTIT